MSYTIDRYEGAKILGCSTRTIDRYISAGKIRSKRIGKKVYLHDEDMRIIQNGGIQEDYIVLDSDGHMVTASHEESSFTRRPVTVDYKQLFDDAQKAIERKDTLIQELSYRAGQAEAELKNSISMIEYKKATMLLESSKIHSEEERKNLDKKIGEITLDLEQKNTLNILLMILISILFVVAVILWFFAL
ncbi:MAG: helix-turn-helix domain-containing protein [Candidatus Gracilibacteria bacterium]|nr:helix-turn-helix domain-containing protein [Candidatus Gracilibacteria bacterium]